MSNLHNSLFQAIGPVNGFIYICGVNKQSSLADLKAGEQAIITGFFTEEIPVKFYEIGLLPGTHIVLEHIAPFNGPVCVSLAGSPHKIALRKKEAASLIIQRTHVAS